MGGTPAAAVDEVLAAQANAVTPPASSGSATGVLQVGSGTAVKVVSTKVGARASAIVAQLIRAGLPAFSRQLGDWHQIIVGPYLSQSEAEEAQRGLAAHGFATTLLVATDGSSRSIAPLAGADAPSATASDVAGADVVLLASGGRTSVVLAMTDEPRQAMVRRTGDTVIEVDVGPVTVPLRARRLTAPIGVGLLEGVSTENVGASDRGRYVRARVSVPPLTQGTVRVAGRRVYIDLTPPWPGGAPPAQAVPQFDALVVVRPEVVRPEKEVASPLDAYRQSIDAALRRFDEIEPFLLSAVSSPQADVLAAVAGTLDALGASMRASDVPAEVKDAHDLFASAVAQVGRVVQPAFAGDRRAEALRAIAQFAEVKRRLKGES